MDQSITSEHFHNTIYLNKHYYHITAFSALADHTVDNILFELVYMSVLGS